MHIDPRNEQLFNLTDPARSVPPIVGKRLHVSAHQVKYAIDSHQIEPAARLGILRVWSEDAIPRVQSALRQIAQNRGEDSN